MGASIRWIYLFLKRKNLTQKKLFTGMEEFIKKSEHNAFQGNSWSILSLAFGGGGGQKSGRLHRKGDMLRCNLKGWEVCWVAGEEKAFWINRDKANDTCSDTLLGLSHRQINNPRPIYVPILGSQDSPLLPGPSSVLWALLRLCLHLLGVLYLLSVFVQDLPVQRRECIVRTGFRSQEKFWMCF